MPTCVQYRTIYGYSTAPGSPQWNGSARSVDSLGGSGYYSFKVSISSIGVIVGLSTTYQASGYSHIEHGLYFSHGRFQIVESGTLKSAPQTFYADDTFHVVRAQNTVYYCRTPVSGNVHPTLPGEPVATSDILSYGTVYLMASLFNVDDTIIDMSCNTLTSINASSQGRFIVDGFSSDISVGVNRCRGRLRITGGATGRALSAALGSLRISGTTANRLYIETNPKFTLAGTALSQITPTYYLLSGWLSVFGEARGTANAPVIVHGAFKVPGLSSARRRTTSWYGEAAGGLHLSVICGGSQVVSLSGNFGIRGRSRVFAKDSYEECTGHITLDGFCHDRFNIEVNGSFSSDGDAYVEYMTPHEHAEVAASFTLNGFCGAPISAAASGTIQVGGISYGGYITSPNHAEIAASFSIAGFCGAPISVAAGGVLSIDGISYVGYITPHDHALVAASFGLAGFCGMPIVGEAEGTFYIGGLSSNDYVPYYSDARGGLRIPGCCGSSSLIRAPGSFHLSGLSISRTVTTSWYAEARDSIRFYGVCGGGRTYGNNYFNVPLYLVDELGRDYVSRFAPMRVFPGFGLANGYFSIPISDLDKLTAEEAQSNAPRVILNLLRKAEDAADQLYSVRSWSLSMDKFSISGRGMNTTRVTECELEFSFLIQPEHATLVEEA